ncbi:MAG: serine protease [Planctomycetes bacterium]|nr:serine protease [Planctomycetota bacterium]
MTRPRFKTHRLCAAALSLLAWLSVAPAWGAEPAATQPAAAPVDPYVKAVARVRPSVVGVGSYYYKDTPSVQYAGTGFVVGDGLTVATNQHVVEAIRQRDRTAQLRVFFPDGAATDGRRATVVAEDRFHDVALLKIEGPAAPALELSEQTPAQGQSVGILGYPIGLMLGLVPATHRGVVAAVVPSVLPLPTGAKLTPELAEAIKRPYNLYQLDMVVFPGNSGSPMFDAGDARVLGIINKTLADRTREHLLTNPSGISYAVPICWVRELMLRSAAERAETPGVPATPVNGTTP